MSAATDGKVVRTFHATDVVAAGVVAWHVGLQGVKVRDIVRKTNRVPRLREEPPKGYRDHTWSAAETVLIVDGLALTGPYVDKDPDALIRAMGITVAVRDAARAEYRERLAAAEAAAMGTAAEAPQEAAEAPEAAEAGEDAPEAAPAAGEAPEAAEATDAA